MQGNGGQWGRADQGNQNPQVNREWLIINHSHVKAMTQIPALSVKNPLKPLSTRRAFKIALQGMHSPTGSGDAHPSVFAKRLFRAAVTRL